MRYLAKNSDLNIRLEIKDQEGKLIDVSSSEVVNKFTLKIFTSGTDEADCITIADDFSKIANCMLRLQSEDVDKLERGQLIIDAYFRFWTADTTDGYYDLRKTIMTNIILVE